MVTLEPSESPDAQAVRLAPPSRRGARLLAALAVLVVVVGASAAVLRSGADEGLSLPAGPSARDSLTGSQLLNHLPWLYQASGSPRIQDEPRRPALVFPAGTTYPVALRRLAVSLIERGALPAGPILGDPLERGVVWRREVSGTPPALDLAAPFGYVIGRGSIRPASFRLPESLSSAQAAAVALALSRAGSVAGEGSAAGLLIDVPALAPCQVRSGTAAGPACRLDGDRR